MMLKDIVAVEVLEGHQLKLRFEDDVTGIVNIADIIDFTGVFAPLRERDYFIQVSINTDIGTICWPNHADIDPDVLYALITGQPVPDLSKATTDMVGD